MGRMHRRRFLAATAVLITTPFCPARAQGPQHARVGFLSGLGRDTPSRPQLIQALREIGWVEERNLTLYAYYADGNTQRLPELADELARRSPHVVVTSFTAEANAIRKATTTIPVVAMFALDPVGQGLAQSLARPAGNVTGVLWGDPSLSAKFLQIAKEAMPRLERMGLLYPTGYGLDPYVDAVERAAPALGVTTHRLPIARAEDVEPALAQARQLRVDALRLAHGGPVAVELDRILQFARANNLATFHSSPVGVERGGFLSYVPSSQEIYALAAELVDKILKGANPAELAFRYPTRYELRVNLATARRLGITLSKPIQAQAILVD